MSAGIGEVVDAPIIGRHPCRRAAAFDRQGVLVRPALLYWSVGLTIKNASGLT
jgi:hypothetical protein